MATVDPELGHRGQAGFIVGPGTPGLRQGKKEKKLGIRASHTAEVLLEDCRIPAEGVVGGVERLEASWSGPARPATPRRPPTARGRPPGRAAPAPLRPSR